MQSITIGQVNNLQTQLDAKLASASYTASDVLTKLLTVDGAGTSLDADLLDGQQGTHYLTWANFTGKPTTLSGYGITDAQGLDAGLTSLAGLTGAGVVTATATDTFAMRAIGAASSTDILDRAAGDGRFAPLTGTWRDNAIPVGAWQRSSDGTNRFHFASGSHTYFRTGSAFYFRNNSDSDIVTISSSGTLSANGDVTAYSSDVRLKENVRPIENPLDKIDRIGGYLFDWRKSLVDELGFQPHQYQDEHGFLAQEIQAIMPDAVRPAPFNDQYLTVKYERVVPLVVEGVKALRKQNQQLRKELDDLNTLLREKGIIE